MSDLSHPDAVVRLAATVHRFKCPDIGNKKLSYLKSFMSTAAPHPKSKQAMERADIARQSLCAALAGFRTKSSTSQTESVSYESVAIAATDYVPFIQQIILSCEVQPDTARLDEKLVFEWSSGVEKVEKKGTRKMLKSEALAYEVSMTVVCQGLGHAGMACDEGVAGNFAAASKYFKTAAGEFEFLAQDQLPRWIARGTNVEASGLPPETTVGCCEGLKLLFLAAAQQMAVATVLVKPGEPNNSLLAKLCLGTAEQLDHAAATFKTKATAQAAVMEPEFFSYIAFQTNMQRSLSLYFQARDMWADDEYGLAIALIIEAIASMKKLPDTGKKSSMHALDGDVQEFKKHLSVLLREWEKDNKSIYFADVPRTVPATQKLAQGMSMMKPEPYSVGDVEPLPLYKAKKKAFLF